MVQDEAGRHVGGVGAQYNSGMPLLNLCATHYGLTGYRLRPLSGGLTGHTHILEHPSASPLVLRVETIGAGGMSANEGVLLALEAQGYPAPRVVRARDGSAAVRIDRMTLVVTTFIEGRPVESEANTPESLYGIGRAIGRLHSLGLLAVPTADFMSTERVVQAEARLLSIEGRLAPEARRRFDEIRQLLAATPSFEETPGCLIHNDCHPGNTILRPDGEIVLIDWDGAGLGHPALDLGFLLITADTYTPDVPAVGTSEERVHAIVDGYSAARLPDPRELQALEAAIRYRVTLINAEGVAHLIERGEPEKIEEWWWNGCEMADSLAERARRRFDEHR
jgi:Ser/Thr protein kinase RdoA (MazF antagonist)